MSTNGPLLLSALGSSPEVLERGLTVPGGQPLHRFVTEQILAMSGFALVLIGELVGEELDRIRLLEASSPEGPIEPFEYELRGTPCDVIIRSGGYRILESALQRFPRDHQLVSFGVEAYTGLRLDDEAGRPVGLICAAHTEAVALPHIDTVTRFMAAFGPRVAADLAHRRAVRDLHEVLDLDLEDGHERLSSMTAALTRALDLDGAFIIDATTRSPELLTLWLDGVSHPPWPLPASTPLSLETKDAAHHAVLKGLPEVSALHSIAVTDGEAITGSVGILSRRSISPRAVSNVVFGAFARRVGRELARRRAEEDRRAAERALSLAQRRETLGVLAGGLAHDFNNLLVSILGNVEALRAESLGDGAHELVDDIQLAAQRAGEFAQQLLAFAGRSQSSPSRIDLGALLAETCRMIRGQLPPDVSLVVRSAPAPLFVRGDRGQLQQVLMNLLTNAYQSGSASIEVAVESVDRRELDTHQVVIGPTSISERAELMVRDTGRGMDETVLDRIFEPFFTTRDEGHGLGLAAVIGIVREHRGTLSVESQHGQGSTFRVFLPLDTSADETPTPRPRSSTAVDLELRGLARQEGWSPL